MKQHEVVEKIEEIEEVKEVVSQERGNDTILKAVPLSTKRLAEIEEMANLIAAIIDIAVIIDCISYEENKA